MEAQYSLSLFPDSEYIDPGTYAAVADMVARQMDPDARLAELTEEARQSALSFPCPPPYCLVCFDKFPSPAYYRGDVRVWSCSNNDCVNSKGVIL